MKTYRVLLFQSYLRKPTLNFGNYLQRFRFVRSRGATSKFSYGLLPAYDAEITRRKDRSLLTRLRRLVGLPNVRVRFERQVDLLFTYGCLVLGATPFVVYLENGLALYNYDLRIARHPLARRLVAWLAGRRQCARLVFMSAAAKQSFFATVPYPPAVARALRRKSIVIYPIVAESAATRTFAGGRSFLFAGHFYMKGGLELAHAYARLRKQYPGVSLTMVTTLRMIRDADLAYLRSVPGLTLRDATLDEAEMAAAFRQHDVFVLPTYREGFGLVLLEALASGMPIIATDQFATGEMVVPGKNGYLFKGHPLQDYDPATYRMLGKYHNPKDFYQALFRLQQDGALRPVEDFLYCSMERLARDPDACRRLSEGSRQLYHERFNAQMLGQRMEGVFRTAIGR